MELDLAGMHQLAAGQGIDPETLDAALSEALRLAYLKTPHAAKHARVELDPRAGSFTVWAQDEIPGEPTEDDPHPAPTLGEEYDDTPHDFGRLAAATARQVISQLFRKAEDDKVFGAFSGQKGKLITGIVQQDVKDTSNVHVAVGDVEALLPRREQVPGERYRHGERIRVYVVNVARGLKGPEIVVSRSHRDYLAALFRREVPEVDEGVIQILGVARDPGSRAKVAVDQGNHHLHDERQKRQRNHEVLRVPMAEHVDPGNHEAEDIVQELHGERIDIVVWSPDIKTYAKNAMAPAVVSSIVVNEAENLLEVIVPDDQLTPAIGRKGQNVKLAARLLGWKIDIFTETRYNETNAIGRGLEQVASVAEVSVDNLVSAGFTTLEQLQEATDEELSEKLSLSDNRIGDLRAAINFLTPVVGESAPADAEDDADKAGEED